MAKSPRQQPPTAAQHEDKRCATCGRLMAWRPKWAQCWDTIRTCSAACRKLTLNDDDRALEQAILTLLHKRKHGASICPSEAARAVFGEAGLEPRAMQRCRYAANRLLATGRVMVTQKGREVEPSTAKGPIRLVLRQKIDG